MLKFLVLCVIYVLFQAPSGVHGMDCSLGRSENVIQEYFSNCPRLILDHPDEKYCCVNEHGRFHCCDIYEFLFSAWIPFLPWIIGVTIIVCVISFICCFCCPYGNVYNGQNPAGRTFRSGVAVTVVTSAVPPTNKLLPAGASSQYQPY